VVSSNKIPERNMFVNIRSSKFFKRYFERLECSLFKDKYGTVVNERKTNRPGK
jgi:hypothetical protein